MSGPKDLPCIGSRRWVAWMLVRLAHRFYDPEYQESITITDEHGQVGQFVIVGDEYGCGVSSFSGPDACGFDPDMWEFGCCDIVWDEIDAEGVR
jgi:hypothetical protein